MHVSVESTNRKEYLGVTLGDFYAKTGTILAWRRNDTREPLIPQGIRVRAHFMDSEEPASYLKSSPKKHGCLIQLRLSSGYQMGIPIVPISEQTWQGTVRDLV